MTMEEYIREEAERRAKLMAPSIAEADGRDACEADGGVDGRITCSVKSGTEYIVVSSRAWNYSGRRAAAHCRGTG